MSERIYYDGFERVEAVHYTQEKCASVHANMEWDHPTDDKDCWDHDFIYVGDGEAHVGQWVIKHRDGAFTVKDEEPVYVVETQYGDGRDLADVDRHGGWKTRADLDGWRDKVKYEPEGWTYAQRHILSNGWTGPWEEIK